ncbi:MAG: site-specific integrase, partial [Acidobacteriaceae bacterium]
MQDSSIFDNQTVAPARQPEPKSPTKNAALLREYIAYLRVEKGLRPLSCEAYERDLLQFAEYLEEHSATLLNATQERITGFLEHLAKHNVESRSAARKLSCLRGFYRWLLLDKRIHRDPTLNLESPATWKVLPKSLAVSEVGAMLDRAGLAADHPQVDAIALRD